MVFNSTRVMSKRLNIRVNVATLMFVFVLLTILYFMLTKNCARHERGVNKPKYRLVIVILTSPDGMRVRDVMRKTWLSEEIENTRHFFAIGTLDVQPEQLETLESEQEKFKVSSGKNSTLSSPFLCFKLKFFDLWIIIFQAVVRG